MPHQPGVARGLRISDGWNRAYSNMFSLFIKKTLRNPQQNKTRENLHGKVCATLAYTTKRSVDECLMTATEVRMDV